MSTTSTSILEQIQEAVRELLVGNVDLDAATVISRAKGNIESQINEALNKLGMSIVVLPPVPNVANPNLPGPYFDTIVIQIHCVEIPATNNTGLTALETAETVLIGLHQKTLKLSNDEQQPMLSAARSAIEPVDDATAVNFVVVNLECSAGLRPRSA